MGGLDDDQVSRQVDPQCQRAGTHQYRQVVSTEQDNASATLLRPKFSFFFSSKLVQQQQITCRGMWVHYCVFHPKNILMKFD
jgi:hypothetical protein